MKITKAVIPAAGLGTRFLPATKAQPKEMLPIVDKPTIQYIIEEAVKSGITDILIITGRNKRAIEDHFDRSIELELELESKEKYDLLEEVRSISEMVNGSRSAAPKRWSSPSHRLLRPADQQPHRRQHHRPSRRTWASYGAG